MPIPADSNPENAVFDDPVPPRSPTERTQTAKHSNPASPATQKGRERARKAQPQILAAPSPTRARNSRNALSVSRGVLKFAPSAEVAEFGPPTGSTRHPTRSLRRIGRMSVGSGEKKDGPWTEKLRGRISNSREAEKTSRLGETLGPLLRGLGGKKRGHGRRNSRSASPTRERRKSGHLSETSNAPFSPKRPASRGSHFGPKSREELEREGRKLPHRVPLLPETRAGCRNAAERRCHAPGT